MKQINSQKKQKYFQNQSIPCENGSIVPHKNIKVIENKGFGTQSQRFNIQKDNSYKRQILEQMINYYENVKPTDFNQMKNQIQDIMEYQNEIIQEQYQQKQTDIQNFDENQINEKSLVENINDDKQDQNQIQNQHNNNKMQQVKNQIQQVFKYNSGNVLQENFRNSSFNSKYNSQNFQLNQQKRQQEKTQQKFRYVSDKFKSHLVQESRNQNKNQQNQQVQSQFSKANLSQNERKNKIQQFQRLHKGFRSLTSNQAEKTRENQSQIQNSFFQSDNYQEDKQSGHNSQIFLNSNYSVKNQQQRKIDQKFGKRNNSFYLQQNKCKNDQFQSYQGQNYQERKIDGVNQKQKDQQEQLLQQEDEQYDENSLYCQFDQNKQKTEVVINNGRKLIQKKNYQKNRPKSQCNYQRNGQQTIDYGKNYNKNGFIYQIDEFEQNRNQNKSQQDINEKNEFNLQNFENDKNQIRDINLFNNNDLNKDQFYLGQKIKKQEKSSYSQNRSQIVSLHQRTGSGLCSSGSLGISQMNNNISCMFNEKENRKSQVNLRNFEAEIKEGIQIQKNSYKDPTSLLKEKIPKLIEEVQSKEEKEQQQKKQEKEKEIEKMRKEIMKERKNYVNRKNQFQFQQYEKQQQQEWSSFIKDNRDRFGNAIFRLGQVQSRPGVGQYDQSQFTIEKKQEVIKNTQKQRVLLREFIQRNNELGNLVRQEQE
ncbi:hypothetical protein PPERSA_02411 [Pseudocohnilembus persalinus]|uniref:Uncharacterized protein n=1 Tax=Pseudocohnilembus persalinus TaxID=266149 RepID=A0A0V0QAP8_PSEPJ|nr:hypothetical protein PPERSA_02411 [Pseudocohnilembus persalinus]|eukprot:KRW99299.1 hypothetical protein PPERSA_02411 [Pseudocohnilembus persalinus]